MEDAILEQLLCKGLAYNLEDALQLYQSLHVDLRVIDAMEREVLEMVQRFSTFHIPVRLLDLPNDDPQWKDPTALVEAVVQGGLPQASVECFFSERHHLYLLNVSNNHYFHQTWVVMQKRSSRGPKTEIWVRKYVAASDDPAYDF